MKAKDFWMPCSFEDRHPFIIDNFLYIPQCYDRHGEFSLPDFVEVFKNDNPVYVEYCSGNGQWICEKAAEFPKINWIAVEKKFDRARKIRAKSQRENLSNVFVVFGDAHVLSEKYLQKNSITEIFINFPDPWPKKKHAKNRLINNEFISVVSKILKNKKSMTIATDHKDYCSQIINTFLNHQSWKCFFDKPYYVSNLSGYGNSFFKDLFNLMEKDIFYMKFQSNHG